LIGSAESRCILLGKKRKLSATAQRHKSEATLAKLLTDLSAKFLESLITNHENSLIPDDAGEITCTNTDGSKIRYRLKRAAPSEAHGYFFAIIWIEIILGRRGNSDFFPMATMYMLGICTGTVVTSDAVIGLQEKIDVLTAHRIKGGRAKKRLTEDQESLAKEYVRAEMKPRVSLSAACRRAAPKLFREHSISVSDKTLFRLFPQDERDNA
jgi:hypothetical protein